MFCNHQPWAEALATALCDAGFPAAFVAGVLLWLLLLLAELACCWSNGPFRIEVPTGEGADDGQPCRKDKTCCALHPVEAVSARGNIKGCRQCLCRQSYAVVVLQFEQSWEMHAWTRRDRLQL